MAHDELVALVRRQPFIPVRIVMTDGSAYEVRHPELIMLGRRSMIVGLPADPAETVYERTAIVDLLHVVRVELAESATAS